MYAEDLVRRVRANEPQAFDELYTRYSPRVFGYLYQRLNGNAEEAEDLTADVFTKVYEKIDGFQPQGAPLSATPASSCWTHPPGQQSSSTWQSSS